MDDDSSINDIPNDEFNDDDFSQSSIHNSKLMEEVHFQDDIKSFDSDTENIDNQFMF